MADQYHSSGTHLQEVFQPLDTFNVQMVSRLVKKQYIRAAQEQLSQLDAHTPTTAKLGSRAGKVFTAKTQSYQRALYLSLIVSTSHHQEAFIVMSKLLNQIMISLRIIIRAVG